METLSFSQDELKLLLSVLNQVTIKLGDAELILPIAKKILSKIKQPAPEEGKIVDKQN